MSSPKITQIFICVSFIVFPSITNSENYIQQEPKNVKYKVGGSASIQCSVEKNIDIRTISLYRRKDTNIFTLHINQSKFSDRLNVSGTYDNFTWILDQHQHTCPNEHSVESGTIACLRKNAHIYLSDGTEEEASFWASATSDYRSRIQLSGTIRSLNITMTGLRDSDHDCYTCRGAAENIGGLIGNESCLTVENSHQRFMGSKVSIALGVVIVKVLLW